MLRSVIFAALMSGTVLATGAALAQSPSTQSPAAQSALPGGATSLRETFEDWQVACVTQNNAKRCALGQEQFGQNRQRVLAIELVPGDNNSLSGTLVMPFGLLFEPGITMQLDDKPFGKPLRVRTCVPAGCIVPLQFDTATSNALKGGATLKLTATPSESTTPVNFAISLKGFSSGLNRTVALAK